MGRGVIGRRRHRRSGHRKFDGVQFIAHVSHDQPLIDTVDFPLARFTGLHIFGFVGSPRIARIGSDWKLLETVGVIRLNPPSIGPEAAQ
jgi:hypothetical protein